MRIVKKGTPTSLFKPRDKDIINTNKQNMYYLFDLNRLINDINAPRELEKVYLGNGNYWHRPENLY